MCFGKAMGGGLVSSAGAMGSDSFCSSPTAVPEYRRRGVLEFHRLQRCADTAKGKRSEDWARIRQTNLLQSDDVKKLLQLLPADSPARTFAALVLRTVDTNIENSPSSLDQYSGNSSSSEPNGAELTSEQKHIFEDPPATLIAIRLSRTETLKALHHRTETQHPTYASDWQQQITLRSRQN
jgi:hypothetical protein